MVLTAVLVGIKALTAFSLKVSAVSGVYATIQEKERHLAKMFEPGTTNCDVSLPGRIHLGFRATARNTNIGRVVA